MAAPNFSYATLDDYAAMADLMQQAQKRALAGRIPQAPGLEEASSARIAELLNPPSWFADIDRRAAEIGAGRGIPGSAAAYGGGLRMTDEERLRRMALGQQFLSAATERNPIAALPSAMDLVITPLQRRQLANQRYEINMRYAQPKRTRVSATGPNMGYIPTSQMPMNIQAPSWESGTMMPGTTYLGFPGSAAYQDYYGMTGGGSYSGGSPTGQSIFMQGSNFSNQPFENPTTAAWSDYIDTALSLGATGPY